MAFKTFCDICDKEIKDRRGEFHVRSYFLEQKYFCADCWGDRKNWPRIHKIDKKSE